MHDYIRAQVHKNPMMGESIRQLVLHPEKPIAYDAGQFFLIRARQDNGEFVERSYSVANYGDGTELEFVIRIESEGKMTSIIDQLGEGSHLDIKGPFGKFGFAGMPDQIDQLVLIAGGVGISPLRSMLQESFEKKGDYPIHVFYGFRTPDDMLFAEELKAFQEEGLIKLTTAISESGFDDWQGNQGYISDFLDGNIVEAASGVQCCICGPPPMVKASREKLLSLGFDRSQVHLEAW